MCAFVCVRACVCVCAYVCARAYACFYIHYTVTKINKHFVYNCGGLSNHSICIDVVIQSLCTCNHHCLHHITQLLNINLLRRTTEYTYVTLILALLAAQWIHVRLQQSLFGWFELYFRNYRLAFLCVFHFCLPLRYLLMHADVYLFSYEYFGFIVQMASSELITSW